MAAPGRTADVPEVIARLDLSDTSAGVHGRFRAVVEAQPQAAAITDGTTTWSFADLAVRAGDVAEVLLELPDPARPVTVLCGHDFAGAATVLGVLLAGRPLLVMDPLVPPARLRGFVQRLGAEVCLATGANLSLAAQLVPGPTGRAIPSPAERPHPARAASEWSSSTVWARPPDPSGLAALGFTSGSTGQPKVVAMNHRHLAGDAWAAATVHDCVRPRDVMAHTLPFAFAAGMNALMTGLLSGATTAFYDTRTRGIAGLAPWMRQTGVTVLHASPAILRALVGTGPSPDDLAALRCLTVVGEAAHGRDVVAARKIVPPTCTIYNRLGSTETGLIAELRLGPTDPIPDGMLPVGEPVGVTRVRLVDESGRQVADGAQGIVEVTRSYLAMGYWQDEEATNAAFRDNGDGTSTFRSKDLGRWDAEGRLCLLGRSDHSVKIRGYLVEPGEIDVVLFTLPEVREAVTVGRPRPGDGVLQLVSYLVPAVQQLSPAAVRAGLREVLPGYMVPQTIVILQALPRTERGKIDRSALPEPPQSAAGASGQEFSAWERLVAQVFEKALSVEDIGLDDDFFELGGDSLAAEALITHMIEGLGVSADATTALLVQAPTVRRLAALLSRTPDRNDVLVPIQTGGRHRPLFVVAGGGGLGVAFLWLARHLGSDQPVWGLQAHGMERRGLPDRSVRAIARRNVAAMRAVQPSGPYLIAGHSFGGLVALEMAHQLRTAGHEVGKLIIMDSYPPDPTLLPADPPLPPLARAKLPLGLALTGVRRPSPREVYWQFYRFSGRLQRRYRGRPWTGDTIVLIAEDSEDRDARSRWDRFLAGRWRMVTVGGDHLSMVREPFVDRTAAAVAEALQEWREHFEAAPTV